VAAGKPQFLGNSDCVDDKNSAMVVTDAEIIQTSTGRPQAFAEVFDRHFASVYAFLARRVGSEEASDLAGDTFCIAFESRDRYDQNRLNALPWLYGIANNCARDFQRRRAKRNLADARWANSQAVDGNVCGWIPQVGTLHEARLDLEAVARCINDAPQKLAEPLLLYVWESLTYEEIAVALNISIGTVRSRISRMRARLRHEIARSERSTARKLTPREAL
jgi:RNA polymerase sigma-70 factor (ECF subfamily)